jgi:hypothetical protein
MSVKVCPTSGPGLMTKSERQRRKAEILSSFGSNSVEQFNKVKTIEMGQTLSEQAKKWLHQRTTRKPKPVKPATVRGWESYLEKHLNPHIGGMLLLPAILVRQDLTTARTRTHHMVWSLRRAPKSGSFQLTFALPHSDLSPRR